MTPFVGVSLAEIRRSLAIEAERGRGPDEPARLRQVEDERREIERLRDRLRANPKDTHIKWLLERTGVERPKDAKGKEPKHG